MASYLCSTFAAQLARIAYTGYVYRFLKLISRLSTAYGAAFHHAELLVHSFFQQL